MNVLTLVPFVGILPWWVLGALEPRIYEGEFVNISEYPFMMSLTIEGSTKSCGASLIKPQYIVTAAHCLEQFNNPNEASIWVKYNCSDLRGKDCLMVKILEVHIHPSYFVLRHGNTAIFDIAVMKLSEALFNIPLVNLPKYDENLEFGTVGIAIEFDYRDSRLRAYQRRVIDCSNRHLVGTEFCTYGGRRFGQCGAPFLINNTLYGITSIGTHGAVDFKFYTIVAYALSFIEKTVETTKTTNYPPRPTRIPIEAH